MELPKNRYLSKIIIEDLEQKMVFLGGPRQVGKTTLAQSIIKNFVDGHPAYLNWDNNEHKSKIKNQAWPVNEPIIIFDEIHKFSAWRNLIKGFYDTLKNTHKFLVTGSARLDHFRKGGDSLLGRYFYYRLHPFTLPELNFEGLDTLFKFGGFPESLKIADERNLRRWHINRVSKLVYEDLRDLENVSDIDKVQMLAEALPSKVGSPLSIQSLSEDLEVAHKTLKRWVTILESLYYCFRIPPYGSSKIKAVKKEQQLYLWDWSQLSSDGERFENMVACHLLKYCHFHEDYNGHKMELRYIRDTDKREVDFVVIKNGNPLFAVEAKLTDTKLSKHINYFQQRLDIPRYYQVTLNGEDRSISDTIKVVSLKTLCEIESLI